MRTTTKDIEARRDRNALSDINFRSHSRSLLSRNKLRGLVWGLHFRTIPAANGRSVTILAIFDEETQECIRSLAASRIVIENVLDELFNSFLHRGIPKRIVSLDEAGLVSNAVRQWLRELELNSVVMDSREYKESTCALIMDKLINELLNEKSFTSLADVQSWLKNWIDEHNRLINLVVS